MRRGYKLYLEDILSSTHKIQKYVAEDSLEDLTKNEMKIDAIVRNFQIIGEAANNIPQEIKVKYPAVEWRKITNFRNILAHEYFGIDYEIMWDIIKSKLPVLQKDIQVILEKES